VCTGMPHAAANPNREAARGETRDVPDPRGGVRNLIPDRARYWEK
jgi:hypothetical protein